MNPPPVPLPLRKGGGTEGGEILNKYLTTKYLKQ